MHRNDEISIRQQEPQNAGIGIILVCFVSLFRGLNSVAILDDMVRGLYDITYIRVAEGEAVGNSKIDVRRVGDSAN